MASWSGVAGFSAEFHNALATEIGGSGPGGAVLPDATKALIKAGLNASAPDLPGSVQYLVADTLKAGQTSVQQAAREYLAGVIKTGQTSMITAIEQMVADKINTSQTNLQTAIERHTANAVKAGETVLGTATEKRLAGAIRSGQTSPYDAVRLNAEDNLVQAARTKLIKVTPTFNAADYIGVSPMTWTVESGDINAMHYVEVGGLLLISFWVGPTQTSGTAHNLIYMKLPNGYEALDQARGYCEVVQGGVNYPARCYVNTTNPDRLYFQKLDESNYALSSNLHVRGQLFFPAAIAA